MALPLVGCGPRGSVGCGRGGGPGVSAVPRAPARGRPCISRPPLPWQEALEPGACGLEPSFLPIPLFIGHTDEPQQSKFIWWMEDFRGHGSMLPWFPASEVDRGRGAGERQGVAVSGCPAPAGCLTQGALTLVGALLEPRQPAARHQLPEEETGWPSTPTCCSEGSAGRPWARLFPHSCRLRSQICTLRWLHAGPRAGASAFSPVRWAHTSCGWSSPRGLWEGASVYPEWPCPPGRGPPRLGGQEDLRCWGRRSAGHVTSCRLGLCICEMEPAVGSVTEEGERGLGGGEPHAAAPPSFPPAPPVLSLSFLSFQDASALDKQMVCFVLFCLACATCKNV